MSLPPINLPPLSPSDALTPATLPAAVRSWQVGQILHATVVNRNDGQTATLRFGASEVPVKTRIPLNGGDAIRVRVDQLGTTITLRLLGNPPPPDTTIHDTLRAALPRQQSFAPLLANLVRLFTPPSVPSTGNTTAPPLPPLPLPIQKQVQALFDALPEARRFVTAQGLRNALRDSGTFAEAKLAASAQQGAAPPKGDLKLELARLLYVLQPLLRTTADTPGTAISKPLPLSTPPPLPQQSPVPQPRVAPSVIELLDQEISLLRIVQELATQLEGALARLQISQLSSLPGDQQPTQIWVAEVPVRQGQQFDLFQFRIEHRRATGQQTEEYWSINFAFELEELGPVRARIVFYQQELSATLWAERETTARKFKERLEELRKRIEKRGFSMRNLDCIVGAPEAESRTSGTNNLINEKA